MQKICILIEREKLFAFKEDGGKYYTQFIQGNESFDYSLSTLRNDFERFIEELKNEFNYDSADFSFIVVLNYDSYRNSIIRSEILGERINANIEKEIDIYSLMEEIVKKVPNNENLVSDYGINFDGRNYICGRKNLEVDDFSLLGYTISPKDVVEYL